jgi:hypothetical protein
MAVPPPAGAQARLSIRGYDGCQLPLRDSSAHRDVNDARIETRLPSSPTKTGVRLRSLDDFPAPLRADGDPDGSAPAAQGTNDVEAAVVNERPAIKDRAGDGEIPSSGKVRPGQDNAHVALGGCARMGPGRAGRRRRMRLCGAPEDRDCDSHERDESTTAPYMRRRRRARCLASSMSASASASGSSFWNSRGSFGRGGAVTVTDTSLNSWR